jgi:hypothetical protein
MNMLSEGFPKAQMMVCGVLGPKSNAHGPNEFLHVPYAKKLTASVAQVIAQLPSLGRRRLNRWQSGAAQAFSAICGCFHPMSDGPCCRAAFTTYV